MLIFWKLFIVYSTFSGVMDVAASGKFLFAIPENVSLKLSAASFNVLRTWLNFGDNNGLFLFMWYPYKASSFYS